MKLFQKIGFLLGLGLPVTLLAAELPEEGDYRICCQTRNKGIQYLEAFPQKDYVGIREEVNTPDQKWHLLPVGEGRYEISCQTVNGGKLWLEAFPQTDSVRPQPQKLHQDQYWKPLAAGDQKFYLMCNTFNKGEVYLEAFPKATKEKSLKTSRFANGEPDQLWQFIPWPQ